MTKQNKILLILVFNTIVLFFFNFAHPVTPALMVARDFPNYANGLAFTAMSIGQFFSSAFWGKQLSKRKVAVIMMVSVIGYGLSQQLFASATTIPMLMIARVLSGIFASGWIIVSYEVMNSLIQPKEKTKYFGYVLMTSSLAAIVGQISSGLIGDKVGIFIPFFVQTIGLIIIGFVTLMLFNEKKIPEEKKVKVKEEKAEEVRENFAKNRIKSLTALFKDQAIVILVVSTLLSLALTAYTNQFGYYLTKHQGADALTVGLVNGYTNLIAMILNIAIVYKFEVKFGALKALTINIIVSLTGAFLFMFAMKGGDVNFGLVILPITMLLFGLGMYLPITQKYILKVTKLNQSLVLGYSNAAKSLGMVLGSMIAGFLYNYGFIYVQGLIVVSLVISLLIMIVYKAKENR